MKRTLSPRQLIAAAFLVAAMAPIQAAADAVSDFYRGKTVPIYVGFPPGGGYDLYARLVAAHFGNHIPGNPGIIVKNLSGGASRKAAAYIANATPQDGAALGMFLDHLTLGVALQGKAKFESDKFVWIGRVTPTTTIAYLWHTAPAKSVKDAIGKEIILAATRATSTSAVIPHALNEFVGTRFRPIVGYRGSAAFALAMERGETQGVGAMSWEAVKILKADWLRDKKINIIWTTGSQRHKELPDVPAIPEFARNADERKIMMAIASGTNIGRALAAEPGIPKDRARALRRAFMAMVRDPAFIADATKRQLSVDPIDGETLQRIVADIVATPKPLLKKINSFIKRKKKK